MSGPIADPRLLGKYRLARGVVRDEILASVEWLPFDARPLRIQPWSAFSAEGDGCFALGATTDPALHAALQTLDAGWLADALAAAATPLEGTLALAAAYRARHDRPLPHFRVRTVMRIGRHDDHHGSDTVRFSNADHYAVEIQSEFEGASTHASLTPLAALESRWVGLFERIEGGWFIRLLERMASGEEIADGAINAICREATGHRLDTQIVHPAIELAKGSGIAVHLRPYDDDPVELRDGAGHAIHGGAAEMLGQHGEKLRAAFPAVAQVLDRAAVGAIGSLDEILESLPEAAQAAWRRARL